MIIDVHDKQGQVVEQTELDDSVWAIEPNIPGNAPGAPATAGERAPRDAGHEDPGRGARRWG